MKIERKGNSKAGYHFYYQYHLCPRKFYLENILGYTPEIIATPLAFGIIIHRAFEVYRKGERNPDLLLSVFEEDMNDNKEYFGEKWNYKYEMGIGGLSSWLRTYHEEDLKKYDILLTEEELEDKIGPSGEEVVFTVKLDCLMKEKKTNNAFVLDTKTTGWSVEKAIETAKNRDQLTGYIMVAQKKYPELYIDSAFIDVLYGKGRQIYASRSDGIRRTKGEIKQFLLNLYGIIYDVLEKVEKLKLYPSSLLFPRNGDVCTMYNRLCDYSPICRLNDECLKKTPIGL